MREKWKILTSWVTESPSPKVLVVRLLPLAILVLVLFWFGGWLPKAATQGAIDAARADIESIRVFIDLTRARDSQESKWFKPEYRSPAGEPTNDKFIADAERFLSNEAWRNEAGNELYGAEYALSQMYDWNPDVNVGWARKASERASDARKLVEQLLTRLDANIRKRDEAHSLYTTLSDAITRQPDGLSAKLDAAQSFYDAESGYHKLKYVTPLKDKLDEARRILNEPVGQALKNAFDALPPLESVEGNGDPIYAMGELLTVKAMIDEIVRLTEEVTAGEGSLSDLKTDREQAQSVLTQASGRLGEAIGYINSTVADRGYSTDLALRQALDIYNEGVAARDRTDAALKNPDADGRIDWTVAHDEAKLALDRANASYAEVQDQRDAHDYVVRELQTIGIKQSEVNSVVGSAEDSLRTLDLFHNADVWRDVVHNLDSSGDGAQALLNGVNGKITEANDYIRLNIQRFKDARARVQGVHTDLDTAKSKAQAVIDRATHLESVRIYDWPSAESNASSTVSAQTSEINTYGSYDSGAVSDYNTAKSRLDQAQREASEGRYEDAVATANSAASLASDTGHRAHQARDDYVAEQERKKREEEEAKRRAEEEAERARQAAEEAAERAREQAEEEASGSNSGYNDSGGGGGGSSDSGDNNSFGGDSSGDNNSFDE